tara:strand:+ start:6097 stop:7239 length:1143 start_codon:yes stop_codon:yes gene_type:complete
MAFHNVICPKCSSSNLSKNGTAGSGNPVYKCGSCGHRPTIALEASGKIADGYEIIGHSKLHKELDDNGNVQLVWEKTRRKGGDKNSELIEAFKDIASSLEIEAPKVNKPVYTKKELLLSYNIGDIHVGMQAWREESGTNVNSKIITSDLLKAMADLISRSPPSETAIVLNMGDAIHFHDNTHATKHNKNPLDTDGRIDKVFRTTCQLLNKMVEMCLAKHEFVVFRNVQGNHDEELAMCLRYQMQAYWRNEPRVSIEMSPADTWFYEWHKVMLMATHGHNMSPVKMIPYMSAKHPEMWGRTKLRRANHGHFHSKSVIESLGGKAECFSNLTPNDAWHESKGYRSELECVSVIYHRSGKELGRNNYMLHHDEVGKDDVEGLL